MKDTRSLLLGLLSVGLVATWVYHFYDKSNYSQQKNEGPSIDSTALVNGVRDSLVKIYSSTIADLDSRLDSANTHNSSTVNAADSLQKQLDIKISEINRLKLEINDLLRKPNTSLKELILARKKINELEQIVSELRDQKVSLESEKQQLNGRLDQAIGEVGDLQKNIRQLDETNKSLAEKIKTSSVFSVSALHFTAMEEKETKEQETSQAKKANKLVMSFILQNNLTEYMNAEIIVRIIGPDGHILQNSAWDSGTFDTKTEGKRSFTRKIKFDYIKGEQKALVFSLGVDDLKKGKYILQVWHDGSEIGEISKKFN